MPLTKSLGEGLHEVRSNLAHNRTARVFFYVSRAGELVLLHGIVKKSQRTPQGDLGIARANQRQHQRGES